MPLAAFARRALTSGKGHTLLRFALARDENILQVPQLAVDRQVDLHRDPLSLLVGHKLNAYHTSIMPQMENPSSPMTDNSPAALPRRKIGEPMPFNNPIPNPTPNQPPKGGLKSIAQTERLIQIALVLPIAVLIGWFFGAMLDRWLHQSWITIVGIILGMIAGMMEAVRMALAAGKTSKR